MSRAATRLMSLESAIERFVEPGAELCFASTPSRANAAIRELCRQFRGRNPQFSLLATGFHSQAHLLALFRLGRRYVSCFFGDNYPTPRPNRLYTELEREGYDLEQWSLWSYCSALAAGAYGNAYAVNRSLAGTALGSELARRGKLVETSVPTAGGQERVSLVRALTPDVTFLHAPLADEHGNVAFSAPFGEGFYGALAARRGCIVTVERVVPHEVLSRFPEHRPLPSHRVLAVCVQPFGAHPQPLHVAGALAEIEPGYADDYAAYSSFRALTEEPALLARFEREVLDVHEPEAAYRRRFGGLEALREAPSGRGAPPPLRSTELEPSDQLLLLAGRALSRRLLDRGHSAILAGIGQAFAACRFAKLLLAERAAEVELMVETGFAGFDAQAAHSFLLSRENVASAARLASVDSMLGALCCGGVTRTIGVIGAGEVDVDGNVNSWRSGGELLVGAGGAPDIAACASEVMVLARCEPRRLVQKVEHVTSTGAKVSVIATDACVFDRSAPGAPWIVRDVVPARAGALKALLHAGSFRFVMPGPPPVAEEPSERELELLSLLRWARGASPGGEVSRG